MDTREERTGIYVRTVTSAKTPQDMAALMRQFAEKHNSRPLSTWLEEIQTRAEAIREADGVPEAIRRDAVEALGHCLSVRHSTDAGDVAEALYEAYQLGMVVERLGVREWEKYAAAGVKARRDQQHASERNQQATEARYRQIVAVVDEIRQESPGLKVESRNREAVTGLKQRGIDVSERTVARAMSRKKNRLPR